MKIYIARLFDFLGADEFNIYRSFKNEMKNETVNSMLK